MKVVLVVAVAAAALVVMVTEASDAIYPLPVTKSYDDCDVEPDVDPAAAHRWKKDCNWCVCRNGRGTCTRRLCRPGESDADHPQCEGRPLWRDECNTCQCVNGTAVCSTRRCGLVPEYLSFSQTPVVERSIVVCHKGSRWRVACNWCRCVDNQHECTNNDCQDWSEATALEEGIVDCHGHSRWKKDCNWCSCSNGRGVCTLRACIPSTRDPFHGLPSSAVCVPGSQWRAECNSCTCAENGAARCTLRACLPGFTPEGPACQEGSVWRNDDCNTCRCINGDIVCTKRLCEEVPPVGRSVAMAETDALCSGEGEGVGWRKDCNWCRCLNGVPACTRRLCSGGERDDSGPVCEGDVSWKRDCNRCRCVDGAAICTSAFCGPLPPRPSPAAQEPECEGSTGDYWTKDCNRCHCLQGKGVCTKRLCRPGEDSTPTCGGNAKWKNDCNDCHCEDGNVVCTERACGGSRSGPVPPVLAAQEPECEGGAEDFWTKDCNRCRCREGKGLCTKRLCRPGEDSTPTCGGNAKWKDDCNYCLCENGNVACTEKACGDEIGPVPPLLAAQEHECEGPLGLGDYWTKDCNRCRCLQGKGVCTKRLCRPDEDSTPTCGGTAKWKNDCNDCHCEDGNVVCTEKACGGEIAGSGRHMSPLHTTSEKLCVDGSRWTKDCNWCSCWDGVPACTKKGCLNIGVREAVRCEGNSTWKDDCNWCTCGDGKAVCTRMACQRKSSEVCVEGTSWREECNTCRCSQGLVMCTKMICSISKQLRPQPRCQEGSCELPELCKLPPVSGSLSCTGFFMKWSFSDAEGKCKQIVYGGCAGTANLFDSQAECEAACPTPPSTQEAISFQNRRISLAGAGRSGGVGGGFGGGGGGSDRCALPSASGPCFAAFQRYAYDPASGACQVFTYGGCDGNANNFETEEECLAACQESKECDRSKCPWHLWNHYLDRECLPQYNGDACCPTSFQCPSPSESGKDPNKCYHEDKSYNIWDPVDSGDPCRAGCHCKPPNAAGGRAFIDCANVECPENLSPQLSYLYQCLSIRRPDKCCREFCCPDKEDCSNFTAATPTPPSTGTCEWDGKSYEHGQKISFSDALRCHSCVCGPDFKGPYGPGCSRETCRSSLSYADVDHQRCNPLFNARQGKHCCPLEWFCPNHDYIDQQKLQEQQQTKQQQQQQQDESAVCRLGDNVFSVGESLSVNRCNLECKCLTPPQLTCIIDYHKDCPPDQDVPQVQGPPECGEGCHAVVPGPDPVPECSCTNDTFTCPALSCPSSCTSDLDLQTGCTTCKCQCPKEVPCPLACPTHTVMDEATGCPRCECRPGSTPVPSQCPAYPDGQVPCPQDCATKTVVDESGCQRCICDSDRPWTPFYTPPHKVSGDCPVGPDGRAPCPMDCGVRYYTDDNGCERCECDPDNTGNPFFPIAPPPPRVSSLSCRTGPDGRAPCPMDCAIIRFRDESGCEVCQCDPDKPGNPFGP